MMCRRGNIEGRDIGAIRIGRTSSVIEVAGRVAAQFERLTQKPDPRDPRVHVRPWSEEPVRRKEHAPAHGDADRAPPPRAPKEHTPKEHAHKERAPKEHAAKEHAPKPRDTRSDAHHEAPRPRPKAHPKPYAKPKFKPKKHGGATSGPPKGGGLKRKPK
jgi:ATP-dependent RNA helicase DeaD